MHVRGEGTAADFRAALREQPRPQAGGQGHYLDLAPLAIMVADDAGRFVEVNPAACRISGYSEEELLAMSLFDLLAEESREAGARHFAALRATGRASGEVCWVREDGAKRWSTCEAVRLADGRYMAILLDLTERKRAEGVMGARLRLLERGTRCSLEELLVATIDEAEALTGSQIGFYHFVDADQQSLSLQAWSTRTTAAFCTAEGKGRHYDVAKAGVWVDCLLARRPVIHNDYASLPHRKGLPPGHAAVQRLVAVPVLRDERIVAILGVGNKPADYDEADVDALARLADLAWDVAERKRAEMERLEMERRLLHAQKLESLGVLAGGIAHDFNNILAAILGFADLAMLRVPEGDPARGDIDVIRAAVERATDLTGQMLAYAGKGSLAATVIDLSRLVEEMQKMLAVGVSKKAALRYDLAEELPAIRADAAQVHQVLLNLVINASESLGDGSGTISVSTDALRVGGVGRPDGHGGGTLQEGLYVRLTVADSGCGMDETTLEKIFDPFFSTKFTGRGLGLAVVDGIVRGHQGAVRVCSEPGKGTVFQVYFRAEAAIAPAMAEERQTRPLASAGGTILVADDEEVVRNVAAKMLGRAGFEVLTAADGEEAVRLFREHRQAISCVLLDLTMPKMDGAEAFCEMRRADPNVRVVLSSGYSEEAVTKRFEGAGLAGFLQKPYRYEAMVDAVRKACVAV